MSDDQPDTNRSSSDTSSAAANPNTNPNKKLAFDWAKRVPSFIAGIAAVWITNTWGFMQERTFGAIEAERDAAIEELESIRPRFNALSISKPIRARYGNDFEALYKEAE